MWKSLLRDKEKKKGLRTQENLSLPELNQIVNICIRTKVVDNRSYRKLPDLGSIFFFCTRVVNTNLDSVNQIDRIKVCSQHPLDSVVEKKMLSNRYTVG